MELERNGVNCEIKNAMNFGEVETEAGKVDGYAMINGVVNYWEFDGCWVHMCERCYPSYTLSEDEQERQFRIKLRDEAKRAKLDSMGVLHYMTECEWHKKRTKFRSKYFHLMDKITEQDILGPNFHGFILVDLVVPEELKRRFEWLGLPILFDRRDSGGQSVTVPSYKSTMLAYKPLLDWFVSYGVQVTKVHYAISYTKSKPFKPFALQVERLRQQAYDNNDESLTELIKLIGNSATGRLGYRQEKGHKMELRNAEKAGESLKTSRSKGIDYLDTDLYQVRRKFKSKQLTSNVHVYNAILQLAKLQLYNKIFGLASIARPGSFSVAYLDTDSFTIGYHDNGQGLMSVVAFEHLDEWTNYKKGLVSDESHCKTLGLLKVEHQVTSGHFVAVGCKQYLFYGDSGSKQSISGLRRGNTITIDQFLSAIYSTCPAKIEQIKYFNEKLVEARSVTSNFLAKPYNKGITLANQIDIIPFDM